MRKSSTSRKAWRMCLWEVFNEARWAAVQGQTVPGSCMSGANFLQSSSVVLYFRLGTETALTTQQCFSYCWAELAQGQALAFPTASPSKQAQEGHSGDSWPKDISCSITSSSAIKHRGVFPELLLLRDWLGISLLVESSCFCIARNFFFPFFSLPTY